MHEEKPSFTIEKDKIGFGKCIIAQWPDGRREVVTGFGTRTRRRTGLPDPAHGSLGGIAGIRNDDTAGAIHNAPLDGNGRGCPAFNG